MTKYLVIAAMLALSVFVSDEIVEAQSFGVGIESPLSAFARVDLGPIAVSVGVPLRLNLSSFGAWANGKWLIGSWELATFRVSPYLGANVLMLFVGESTLLGVSALAGLEIPIPETQFKLYTQLGLDPFFSAGLVESLSVGVGYHF